MEKKKPGGQLGNKGGRPRKYRKGTVTATISVPAEDSAFIRQIAQAIHNDPEIRRKINEAMGLTSL